MIYSKRGFSSVFLTMILTSMIMLTFAFVKASSSIGAASVCNSVYTLAGQSVLSEFDIDLKNEFGVIAFSLNNSDIEDRLSFYSESTFNNKGDLNMIPINVVDISVDLKSNQMFDLKNMEQEISRIMKFSVVRTLIKDKGKEESDERMERNMKNQVVIGSLPSNGLDYSGIFLEVILNSGGNNILDIIEKEGKSLIVDQYIHTYFNDNKNFVENRVEGFFKNEKEYIIYGNYSDKENRDEFLSDFVKLRTIFNVSHIYSDKKKLKEVSLLASILTPGPTAVATQGLIIGAWAYAEAINDSKLLNNGKKVQLIKNSKNWALNINSYERIEGDIILPEIESGFTYSEYIDSFIALTSREAKLFRIMDLIQINMMGKYNKKFLIKEYYNGFNYQILANGMEFNYHVEY